jgi:hypothetical protein
VFIVERAGPAQRRVVSRAERFGRDDVTHVCHAVG